MIGQCLRFLKLFNHSTYKMNWKLNFIIKKHSKRIQLPRHMQQIETMSWNLIRKRLSWPRSRWANASTQTFLKKSKRTFWKPTRKCCGDASQWIESNSQKKYSTRTICWSVCPKRSKPKCGQTAHPICWILKSTNSRIIFDWLQRNITAMNANGWEAFGMCGLTRWSRS